MEKSLKFEEPLSQVSSPNCSSSQLWLWVENASEITEPSFVTGDLDGWIRHHTVGQGNWPGEGKLRRQGGLAG